MNYNYNYTIQRKKDFLYPYMKCESWTITANGILIKADDNKSGEDILMTPNWLDLTLWKAAYYDRGRKLKLRW